MPTEPNRILLAPNQLTRLLELLRDEGYEVIGPILGDGAITYGPLESAADLPAGWTDEQAPGRYRLKRRDDGALFGFAVGPQSWKKYLHPAAVRLWSAKSENGQFRILNDDKAPGRRYALVGVRACELAAIAIQDRVLLGDRYRDPVYGRNRAGVFVVAVQCGEAGATCFCASMGTGPRLSRGFDVALAELTASGPHRFLAWAGSQHGENLLASLESSPAASGDLEMGEAAAGQAAAGQTRAIDSDTIKSSLDRNFESPRWDQVAERCLSCGNCTLVCPTCFCTNVEDSSDLTGTRAERWRRWDSCFTLSFSYIHGGSIRASTKARYRQWITHKLASWVDQFGASGCVGCGRCITWCPAGIDLTEEAAAIQETERHGNA